MTAATVITPAYRAEATIGRAVRSVLAQTRGDWEMIVVSDDRQDYGAIVRAQGMEDARLRFATTGQMGAGPGAARNLGLALAAHPIAASLDADDAYAEDYLSLVLPCVEKFGACSTSCRLIDEESGEETNFSRLPAVDTVLEMPHLLCQGLAYSSIVFDRRSCRAAWPENVFFAEDMIFWIRILDELPGIHYCARACYRYFWKPGTLSRPDNADTHSLSKQRKALVGRLMQNELSIRNIMNRDFFIRWLQACNEIEATFDHKIVHPALYRAALEQRLGFE